jgi:hypothetical protein
MHNSKQSKAAFLAVLMLGGNLISNCFAGESVKWSSLPEVVRATILANGGTEGQSVDKETKGHTVDGNTIYEAGITDKNGRELDIVVKGDGKLVKIKTDGAADAAAERASSAGMDLSEMKFSHPEIITNLYLPLANLKQDILEGTEDGKKIRVERTALPNKHKTFKINGQKVKAAVYEDRAFLNGELEEVATDYFAQDDEGNVYYLGEEVDEYENGKIKGHDGAWMLGKDTKKPGLLVPAHPKIGDKFMSEDVSNEIRESDVVISLSETVIVPSGTYTNCLKIEEHPAGEGVEYKYYAPGVGVVREVPTGGDEQLISHQTK